MMFAFGMFRSANNMFRSANKKYNPLINYDWSTKNINGLRYLTDNGKSPKYDAQLYFGQGVYFNGVDQKVDYDTLPTSSTEVSMTFTGKSVICNHRYNFWITHYGYAYYLSDRTTIVSKYITYDSTKTYTLNITPNLITVFENGVLIASEVPQSILGGGARTIGVRYTYFYPSIIKDVFMFNRVLSQSEITQSYEQPEAFYAMAQADATCVLNMPMCENDGYVRNMKTYSEGIELAVNGDFSNNNISAYFPYNATLSYESNKLLVTSTGSGAQVKTKISSSNNKLVAVKVSINNTATRIDLSYYKDSIFTPIKTITSPVIGTEYLIVAVVPSGASSIQILPYGLKVGDTFYVHSVSIKELTGIQPIQNYTTQCKTSAQNLSYGLQTCKFNRDSLGVIKGINAGMECRGIGYATTGWTPPINDNFSIECIMNFNNDLQYNFNGSQVSSTNRFMFGQDITGLNARLLVNSKNVLANSLGVGYHLFSITRSGTTFNLSIDGIFIGSITETLLALNSFYLGRANPSAYSLTNNNIRLFKVHDKALTQAEITKNYQSYQQKGLLA